jgi:hypothetical protein
MEITPKTLRKNRRVREMLSAFDFEVVDQASDQTWFQTENLQPFEIVAKRGSGCLFSIFGPHRLILLVTSEGEAAVVAASLREYLELVVQYPYWQDMVTRSEGDLGELRNIFRDGREPFEEEALDDNPEIEEYRPALTHELGLMIPADPAGQLHIAIYSLGADVTVDRTDGYSLSRLF